MNERKSLCLCSAGFTKYGTDKLDSQNRLVDKAAISEKKRKLCLTTSTKLDEGSHSCTHIILIHTLLYELVFARQH